MPIAPGEIRGTGESVFPRHIRLELICGEDDLPLPLKRDLRALREEPLLHIRGLIPKGTISRVLAHTEASRMDILRSGDFSCILGNCSPSLSQLMCCLTDSTLRKIAEA